MCCIDKTECVGAKHGQAGFRDDGFDFLLQNTAFVVFFFKAGADDDNIPYAKNGTFPQIGENEITSDSDVRVRRLTGELGKAVITTLTKQAVIFGIEIIQLDPAGAHGFHETAANPSRRFGSADYDDGSRLEKALTDHEANNVPK